jgi:hypothetical protein
MCLRRPLLLGESGLISSLRGHGGPVASKTSLRKDLTRRSCSVIQAPCAPVRSCPPMAPVGASETQSGSYQSVGNK